MLCGLVTRPNSHFRGRLCCANKGGEIGNIKRVEIYYNRLFSVIKIRYNIDHVLETTTSVTFLKALAFVSVDRFPISYSNNKKITVFFYITCWFMKKHQAYNKISMQWELNCVICEYFGGNFGIELKMKYTTQE